MARSRLCSLLLATLLAASAEARTYFVSPVGRNGNDGSAGRPFRTITYAAAVARPGDTIRVRGGVYYQTVYIASKGTNAAPLRLISEPGQHVTIDGSASPAGSDLVTLDRVTNVELSGFEVRYSKNIGISVWGSTNVRIVNNDVHHSVRNGICASFKRSGSSSQVVVDRNRVHENVLENQRQALGRGGWASAITLARTNGARVTNNQVFGNFGEGIGAGMTDHSLIAGNVVFDNFSANVYVDNARFVTIDRNLIYNTGLERVSRFGQPAVGIGLANEHWAGSANPLRDITITNNIVINTRAGLLYGAYERGGGLKNTVVANNTFYKATTALLSIDRDAHAGSIVENNIFYQAGGGAAAEVGGRGIVYRHNNWFGAPPGPAAGTGDVLADPLLVNPGGRRASDYRVRAGSPVLRMGLPVPAVAGDYFGTKRGDAYDIGACQRSSPERTAVSRPRDRRTSRTATAR